MPKISKNEIILMKGCELNKLLTEFSDFLDDNCKIRESTKNLRLKIVKQFLIYLNQQSISSFKSLSSDIIFKYLNCSNLSNSTKSSYLEVLKIFFNFTFQQNLSSFSGSSVISKIKRNPRERILSFYTQDEISKLISSIDSSTTVGKRNYAIVLLAAITGLRASDIVNLKFENIDWGNKTLKFTQVKTQKELVQPFPDEILFAILDYLKNGRPQSDSKYLFIRHKIPFDKISPSVLSVYTTTYFKEAGIDISSRKHGLHSLRHSFANNMLHNNISLQNISASLGHSVISTTTMYTNIDINTLKLLSLEVD